MQTLNYSPEAIKDLREMAAAIDREVSPSTPMAVFAQWTSIKLEESVKFILPDNGRLLSDGGITPAKMDLLRLPFPIVALEYSAPDLNEHLGEGYFASPKRIALAIQLNQLKPGDRRIMEAVMPGCTREEWVSQIGVISIYLAEDEDSDMSRWVPSLGMAMIDPGDALVPKDVAIAQGLLPETPATGRIPKGAKFGLPTYTYPVFYGQTKEELVKHGDDLLIDCQDETISTVDFCAVMNCGNIETDKAIPSAKLNKKRMAQNKIPLFEYHILSLSAGSQPGRGESGGGSHASPRMHLRRGHIRILSGSKKPVWVNAAVVGHSGHGQIVKEYDTRKMAPK